MPYYKLVASGRSDVIADEIIIARDSQTGEPTKTLSPRLAQELSEDELVSAQHAAGLIGYRLYEVDEPDEEVQRQAEQAAERPALGADVFGMAPPVESTGVSGAEINQEASEAEANQQTGTDQSDPSNANS